MDEVEHLRLTDLNKSIYKNGNKRLNEYLRMQRKAWDALDQVSRLGKVATHTMLVFAAMNLKKLATWLWKARSLYFLFKNSKRSR